MPKRYKRRARSYKPKKQKRSFRRSFKGKNTAVTIGGKYGPVPKFLTTKLKFNVINVQPAVGLINFWNLSMNDLTDPGVGLSAVGPVFFDGIMSLYGSFVVHACKLRLTVSGISDATAGGDGYAGAFPSVSAAQAANVNDGSSARSQPQSKYGTFMRFGAYRSVTKHYAKIKNVIGVKDVQDVDDLKGTQSTAPVSLPIWRCFVGALNNTTNTGFNAICDLTYYCTFFRVDNEDQP